MKGSTYKRCGCRDPKTRKQLGAKCPKLRRSDHGSWWGRYDLPKGPNNTRKEERIGPFETVDEAEDALRVAISGVKSGTNDGTSKDTFAEYLDTWIKG